MHLETAAEVLRIQGLWLRVVSALLREVVFEVLEFGITLQVDSY